MAGKSGKTRKLVFSDGKSNKFWNINLKGSSYTITFGRVGTAGQSQEKSFDSAEAAEKAFEKLVAEKLNKGYSSASGDSNLHHSLKVSEEKHSRPASSRKSLVPKRRQGERIAASLLSSEQRKKIQSLLTAKSPKAVNKGLLLLRTLKANQGDYEAVFTPMVIRGLVHAWNPELLLATSRQLLPYLDVCKRLVSAVAEKFCKASESEQLKLLQGVLHQPLCFVACHADSTKHRLDLDMSDGTILWDVFHRELLESGRVKIEYREDSSDGISTCLVHSHNGIHLAGYDRSEGRPDGLPIHVLAVGEHDSSFPSQTSWFEAAWALSVENTIGNMVSRTTENWDAFDWCWGDTQADHLIIAMLGTWFRAEGLTGPELKQLQAFVGQGAMPLLKRKSLFQWTEEGSRSLLSYWNKLLRHRVFRAGGFGSVFTEWPDSPYLPWQSSEPVWQNEFEVRVRRQKKEYASYQSLSQDLKHLAYQAAVAIRDAAKGIKSKTDGLPVIEGIANHTLICMALHPATPHSVLDLLARDTYKPVVSAAKAGRLADADNPTPAEAIKGVVEFIVRGTGGRSRPSKTPGELLDVAKRLSKIWAKWKQADSFEDVPSVNTESPRTNESRMRAVAMGVAVVRGWIIPTSEGASLMRKCADEIENFVESDSDEEHDCDLDD